MTALLHTFVGGPFGNWRVEGMRVIAGQALPSVPRLSIFEGHLATALEGSAWMLRGATSYERYVRKTERSALVAQQAQLGRLEASKAALIPIKKSPAWWELAQDERRAIFEEHSHHITTGLNYVARIARRLYHSHDLGEPFDFLTWFEFAPGDTGAFEELVGRLRETEEWTYVEREVDIRLALAGTERLPHSRRSG
jgi:chlorite dismutase